MKNILSNIISLITRKPRYFPEIIYEEKSYMFNCFRFFESIFGRKYGVRSEMSAFVQKDGIEYRAFHTIESALVYFEGVLRGKFKFKFVKIYVPQMVTPQGIQFQSPYLFAIAHDTSGNAYENATTNASLNLTASGSDRIAIIYTLSGGGNRFSSVTVDGNATTTFQSNFIFNTTQSIYGIYYIAPPTSSVAYVFTLTDSTDDQEIGVLLYSGAAQSGQVDSSNTGSGPSTLTLSTTVVASNCWLTSCVRANIGGANVAGTGTTLRQLGTSLSTGDSNGTVGTGSQSMDWDHGGANLGGIICSIAPAAAAGPATLKTADTVTAANVKTMNGVAIASIKTIDTAA